jgi:glycosyl transferase family 2
MPDLSLVVVLHGERDLIERLLNKSQGCYDDLVVVHDGPDEQKVRAIVEAAGGRFFERPRAFQQEPHLPFAWEQAACDWILKMDSDEFPSDEMRKWLEEFRRAPEPPAEISGYTFIWPLWNGKRMVSKKLWDGRFILFNRQRIRFIGHPEQGPIPDGRTERTGLILVHQPRRKSYGFYNVLIRRQAWRWREAIAKALLGKPTDLPCWRWTDENWPPDWEQIRQHPLRTAVRRLTMETFRGLRAQWRADRRFYVEAALNGPINHALLGLKFWLMHRKDRKRQSQITN